MHEPGEKVGPSRSEWDRSPGNGPLGGSQLSEGDLDRLLAELKAPEETAPAPGFYARVMDRIETQGSKSIWSVFLEPLFGRRLAVASGLLLLVLGAAMLVPGSEVEDELIAGSRTATIVASPATSWEAAENIAIDSSAQDKDAVLVNLVTYQEH
jgi:hypothetical protein